MAEVAHAWRVPSPICGYGMHGQVFKDGKPIGEVVEVNAEIEIPRVPIPRGRREGKLTIEGTIKTKSVDPEWEMTLFNYFRLLGAVPVWE